LAGRWQHLARSLPACIAGKANLVTQRPVERTIGKLMTDASFRARFFADPAASTWEAGLVLSPAELTALSALSRTAVIRFSETLDPRISRLCVDPAGARPQPANDDDAGAERAT
jgi:hypothetical protein